LKSGHDSYRKKYKLYLTHFTDQYKKICYTRNKSIVGIRWYSSFPCWYALILDYNAVTMKIVSLLSYSIVLNLFFVTLTIVGRIRLSC